MTDGWKSCQIHSVYYSGPLNDILSCLLKGLNLFRAIIV